MDPKQWIAAYGEVAVVKTEAGVIMGYKGTPWGDILFAENAQQWYRDFWANYLAPYLILANNFSPTFLHAEVIYDVNGQTVTAVLNSTRFADRGTAQWIADKYGNGIITAVPYMQEANGLSFNPPNVWNFTTKDGRSLNAGDVAAYYARNDRNSAESLIRQYFGL